MPAPDTLYLWPARKPILSSRIVWLALFVCVNLAWSSPARAGCYFGHTQPAQAATHLEGYAREFRILGQWIYERGQIKYVSWQADSPCHGPNCSADSEPPRDGDMSLPQSRRPQPSQALCSSTSFPLPHPLDWAWLPTELKPCPGFPTAYEYPP